MEAVQLKGKVYIKRHTVVTAGKSKLISHTANGTQVMSLTFCITFLPSFIQFCVK